MSYQEALCLIISSPCITRENPGGNGYGTRGGLNRIVICYAQLLLGD